ncbi:universal stress protein A-like protein [Primulina eburnea]|uniref:universal stress protein A-like protein n=1 Tax=Primulina eburnea TaxID=1245227 RepID=UPI003C6BE9E0
MDTGRELPQTSAREPAEGAESQPLTASESKKLNILVALDESDGSFYALSWALDHFFTSLVTAAGGDPAHDQLDSSMVTLVNVQPLFHPFIYPAGPVVYATPAVTESVKKAQQQNSAAILGRGLQMCKEKKIKAEPLILEGDPKEKICVAAEQLHADVLVVGSRGLGAIKRALLGSVSNYCAHHVRCPVLIVKPPAKVAPS